MKEKIKNIVVSPNKEFVIWSVNLDDIVRNTVLDVDVGCVALYIVNGMLKSINTPGRWMIKSKEEDKAGSMLQLICVNTDKTFDIFCGVGNIPFKDFDLNIETVVGAHGECKIRISQPWTLYTSIGHANITVDEIDEYVKLKLSEMMTVRLAEVLQHYDYDNIMTQQTAISADLEKRFSQRLNDIGIEVVSFALAGIKFTDEYQNYRKSYFEGQNQKKADKEERRIKEREQRAEIDNLKSLISATEGINVPPVPPAGAVPPANAGAKSDGFRDINQPIKYCPRCGMKMSADAAFCPGCGKKL